MWQFAHQDATRQGAIDEIADTPEEEQPGHSYRRECAPVYRPVAFGPS